MASEGLPGEFRVDSSIPVPKPKARRLEPAGQVWIETSCPLVRVEAATRTRNGSLFFQVGCGKIAYFYNERFSPANSRGAIRLSPLIWAISGQDSLA